jgi:xanthine dehydrogenase YagS FAD-binding subunit
MDAFANVQGPDGERRIPIEELHRLPGDEPRRDTTLEHGELITSVDLPPLDFLSNSKYRKVRERASYAFALVSVAAALDVEDGAVRNIRLALGGVAHKPWRATKAEEALRGEPANEANFRAAADIEFEDAEPLRDNAFKIPLARNVITRTLLELSEER